MTWKAVGLGVFLAFVFGAANAYLGMKAGQTVAATIPAAVIAMALFRLPAFRGGILEQNIARTAASVGEALVAGAIFTIPAFMMVDVNGKHIWTDLRSHYWEASLILLVGGLHRRAVHHRAAAAAGASTRRCRFRKAWRATKSSEPDRARATLPGTSSARWHSRD